MHYVALVGEGLERAPRGKALLEVQVPSDVVLVLPRERAA